MRLRQIVWQSILHPYRCAVPWRQRLRAWAIQLGPVQPSGSDRRSSLDVLHERGTSIPYIACARSCGHELYSRKPSSVSVGSPNHTDIGFALKVVLGGVLVLSLVWYYFPVYGGVHWFTGPVSTINKDGEEGSGRSSTSGSLAIEKNAVMVRQQDP